MIHRGRNLSASISETAPTFCTVYAVSKGKLSSVRASSTENNRFLIDDNSDTSSSSNNSTSHSFSSQGGINFLFTYFFIFLDVNEGYNELE